jgi:hypothetical protein
MNTPHVVSPGGRSVAAFVERATPGRLEVDVVVVGTGAGGGEGRAAGALP